LIMHGNVREPAAPVKQGPVALGRGRL